MIHISVIELGVTCGLVALVFIIPVIVKRSYANFNKRLKKIETRMDKKDS